MKAKDGDNRINFKGRVIIIIVAVALVIAAGYYYWDTISVYFGRLFSGDTAKELTYAGYSNSSYAGINGGIAVASTRGIQVIDGNGEQKVNDSFEMKSPAVKVEGDFGIAFDIGGNTAKVFDESSIKYKVESKAPIVSASVNEDGLAVVCTQEEGYNGLVTVYDSSGNVIFEWYSGEAHVITADISENNKSIAVLGVTSAGSRIVFFNVDSEDEQGRYELAGDVIIDMKFQSKDTVVAISNSRLVTVGTDGNMKKEYDFGSRYLRNYCFGDDSTHLLVLSDYQVGDKCTAVTVKNGKERGTVTDLPSVVDVSIYGSKFALLFSQEIRVYSTSGKEKSVYENMSGIEDIIVGTNGTVLAVKTYSAQVLS